MRASALLALICLALAAGGCAGYKLGPTNGLRAGEKSIQINPIVNSTLEPRLGEELSHAVRKKIQHDGTYRLDTGGTGDVIVSVDITKYHRSYLALQRRDTLTARDYELIITATVVAMDRVTGREILRREVRGKTTAQVGSDLVSLERQARPLLTENLAQNITDLLVDGEW